MLVHVCIAIIIMQVGVIQFSNEVRVEHSPASFQPELLDACLKQMVSWYLVGSLAASGRIQAWTVGCHEIRQVVVETLISINLIGLP